jgi:hypothetical protein
MNNKNKTERTAILSVNKFGPPDHNTKPEG